MAIFVVGDLHLSLGGDKPMDVFEGWEGYLPKLEANWRTLISPQDTVILEDDIAFENMKKPELIAYIKDKICVYPKPAGSKMAAERQP